MKAMLIDKNKNFVWTEVPDPLLADDGVIVEFTQRHLTVRICCNVKGSILRRRVGPHGPDWNLPAKSSKWAKLPLRKAISKSATTFAHLWAAARMPKK